MFNREERKKIESKSLQQWQQEQRESGWLIETDRWPFPLTADDLKFLKINRISTT